MSEKILLVWDRLGDYHRARVKALQNVVGKENVFYADLGAADNLYKWSNSDQADSQYFLLSQKPVQEADAAQRLENFKKIIQTHQIKVVGIAGYGRKEYRMFLWYCYRNGIKVVLFAESWYGKNVLFNQVKGSVLKLLCSGFLVSGERAKQHFHRQLGIPLEKIRTGYSSVDNAHFAQGKRTATNDKKTILCVARFSEEKNLSLLIKAYQAAEINGKFRLLLVGGGKEEATLRQLANNNPDIILRNWASYDELPDLYASADYFILPSSFEPWGLVANEAAAVGLPLILSQACGCLPELLDEKNGFSFAAHDQNALIQIFNRLQHIDDAQYQAMSEHSRKKVDAISSENWAKQFVALSKM
jgi:glycosyltransferase involved in cell wall biosynthesis